MGDMTDYIDQKNMENLIHSIMSEIKGWLVEFTIDDDMENKTITYANKVFQRVRELPEDDRFPMMAAIVMFNYLQYINALKENK